MSTTTAKEPSLEGGNIPSDSPILHHGENYSRTPEEEEEDKAEPETTELTKHCQEDFEDDGDRHHHQKTTTTTTLHPLLDHDRRFPIVPIIETLSYVLIFITLGMGNSILGPKLSQLAAQVGGTVKQMGWIFTGRSIGSILGNLVSGKLFDYLKVRSTKLVNVVVAVMGMLYGIMFLAIPYMSNLYLLVLGFIVLGFTAAFTIMGSNLGILWAWKARATPVMLGAHCMFGVGSFVAPLMLRYVSSMRVAFAVICVVSTISALSTLIGPIIRYVLKETVELAQNNKQQGSTAEQEQMRRDQSMKQNARALYVRSKSIRVAILLGVALSCIVTIETIFASLLFPYNEMNNIVNEEDNKMMMTVYFLCFTLGRVIATILSSFIRPMYVMMIDISGCFISTAGFFLFAHNKQTVYIFSCIMGASVASMYPVTYAFPNSSMEGVSNTGVMSTIMLVMTGVTGMVVPVLITEVIGIPNMFWTVVALCFILAGAYMWLFVWAARLKKEALIQTKPMDSASSTSAEAQELADMDDVEPVTEGYTANDDQQEGNKTLN